MREILAPIFCPGRHVVTEFGCFEAGVKVGNLRFVRNCMYGRSRWKFATKRENKAVG